jgi:hypothetical protein
MPAPKPLSREAIIGAMARTKSNRAAARYLSVSFYHYRRWAKLYVDEETGQTFWDKHKNQSGAGIPKMFLKGFGQINVLDIIEGKVSPQSFLPARIKERFIVEGYLEEKCYRCGFDERRVLDYKVPLLLAFKDGDKRNYAHGNVELLCYNCYFLTIGDVFQEKQIQGIEDTIIPNNQETPTWDLDDYHLTRLKELGLEGFDQSELEYISRI